MVKFILPVLVLLAVIGAVLWRISQDSPRMEQTGPTSSQTSKATPKKKPVSNPAKLIIGDAAAAQTIIEYGDFQCPICKRFFEQTGPELRKRYIDNGKAKIEFRVETHLGEESIAAGQAAWCANDQGKFEDYHDELYRRQSGTNSGIFSASNLKLIAGELGLDSKKFDSCLDSQKYLAKVQASNAQAQAAGVTATPTFVIGSRKIVGAQPIGIFEAVLDE